MLIRARHYRTDLPIDAKLLDGRIAAITPSHSTAKVDLEADLVAPAYFDLQINGGMGVNFTSNNLSRTDIGQVVSICASHGIAAFCPTIITAADETIRDAMKALAQACEASQQIQEAMPCFHLEGPFISREDGPRGAHPKEHVQLPDWNQFEQWQNAAGGRIRLVTLAPELPGALPFIEKLTKHGMVASLGHTAATPAIIRDAVAAGARLSTHLGNGCARLIPRHENVLWEQLASDALFASIIPDGHHLPWNVVQCIGRCKSLDRLIITCDASPLAGLAPGRYSSWGSEVEITPEGKIVLIEQGVLAGSWDFTVTCVEKIMHHLGLTYAQIHPLAVDNPCRLLGLEVPSIDIGQPANLVLLRRDQSGQIKHSHAIIRGKVTDRSTSVSPVAVAAH